MILSPALSKISNIEGAAAPAAPPMAPPLIHYRTLYEAITDKLNNESKQSNKKILTPKILSEASSDLKSKSKSIDDQSS